MYRNFRLLPACCCVTVFGCSAQPVFVPLPTSHPASPWALESPISPPSGTLAINKGEMVPPHPDWQIPGMRQNEMHGHAAGDPTPIDMMGHGHRMMSGGHGKMTGEGHGSMHGGEYSPGMVKMSAPPDKVDYTPEGAVHPSGPEPDEHKPEMHLDHTDSQRREAGYKAAPIAPPMEHDTGHEGHQMPEQKKSAPGKAPATKDDNSEKPAQVDHEAMGHTMDHSGPAPAEETPAPESAPAPTMDHSHHGA